jgi:hypothetical protein
MQITLKIAVDQEKMVNLSSLPGRQANDAPTATALTIFIIDL